MEAQEEKATTRSPKRMKRKEVLEKKKAVDELIISAYSQRDHLSSFPTFRRYCNKGLSVHLESRSGDKLSSFLKQYIQKLLKVNMEVHFGSEWPIEEKVKRREMAASEACYVFVCEDENTDGNQMTSLKKSHRSSVLMSSIVGFVHYRFIIEEGVPVLYLYELQLESHVQGKGLGKFLMQLVEAIAQVNGMSAVVLTVQKANVSAMKFYITKLRYIISSISPSRVHVAAGLETNYEILCKVFDDEAKSALQ